MGPTGSEDFAVGPSSIVGEDGPPATDRRAGLDDLRAVLTDDSGDPRDVGDGRGPRSGRRGSRRGSGRGRRDVPPDPEADPRSRGEEPDPHDWARQIVLRQLTAAPRSRSQLAQTLRRKDCPDEVATAVLDRMEEVGLVDDEAYAGMLVRSQQAGRGLARRALRQELRRKGVDDETAAAALDEVDPHAEEERARGLVARKMRSMHGLEAHVQTRRLAGMLARKGYDAEVAMRVVREAVREAPEHRPD
ncbi:regulatory protein RecX [Phycicoccus sp. BSK3Z-2]|uniref:Regulatory protein RecX n=1 Tax=Phycicoccus avicenniae TaxID=2828860 RepID=A0A941D9S7_9MICO|nr:regulatory protein RecX [Phycicoccus avicenniae]